MHVRHEPSGWACPFCTLLAGTTNANNIAGDIVARGDLAFARIASKWWPANPSGVLVILTAHHENLYDLPTEVGHAVWDLTQRVAIAMRATYGCTGVSTR